MSVNSSMQSARSDPFRGLEAKSCDPFWACCLNDYEYEDDHDENKKLSRLSTRRKDRSDAKKRRKERCKRKTRIAKADTALNAEVQAQYQSLVILC
jgi:hypothetical protein